MAALTLQQVDQIIDGIEHGRNLKQIEKALKVDVVEFLRLTQADEAVSLRYNTALAISSFALSAEMTELLRLNVENPVDNTKNVALKLYMERLKHEMESRNPAIFSGKAPITQITPVQIVTLLDMGGQQTLEGVYNLTSEINGEIDASKANLEVEPPGQYTTGEEIPAGNDGLRALPQPQQAPKEGQSEDIPPWEDFEDVGSDESLLQEAKLQDQDAQRASSTRTVRQNRKAKAVKPQKRSKAAGKNSPRGQIRYIQGVASGESGMGKRIHEEVA